MKKTFNKLLIFTLILISSCQKDFSKNENQESDIKPTKSSGTIHNEILDAIAYSPSFPFVNQAESFKIIETFMNKNYGESLKIDYIGIHNKMLQTPQSSKKVLFGDYHDAIIEQLTNSKTSSEFIVLSNSTKLIIEGNDNLTKNEKFVILNSLDVMQKSYQYWESALKNQDNPWYKLMVRLTQSNTNNTAPTGWCLSSSDVLTCVAVSDAVGYSDAYWSVYNGNNQSAANNAGQTQGAYLSGTSMGLTMN